MPLIGGLNIGRTDEFLCKGIHIPECTGHTSQENVQVTHQGLFTLKIAPGIQ